jgi:chloramphenicol 3-O phosphotransferase
MTKAATVILLNGVGSAGKSSIAKALQQIAAEPFLHVAMDDFLDMLPARYFDHPDGLVFEPLTEDGKPSIAIHTGPVCERLLGGMRHAAAALAEFGNNLVIDEVLMGADETSADYQRLLAPYRLYWVGVMAPLEILEAREHARADRMVGLARWQFSRVHAGLTYDLEIDTSQVSPQEAARIIKDKFAL